MDNLTPGKYERAIVDRRGILDRRLFNDNEIMSKIGYERRSLSIERRKKGEQRKDWVRITKWSSIPVSAV